MSLELNDVGYVYAQGQAWAQHALEAVSLTVSRGELVLVVGPTGSGKSTLLRCAAGLLAPSRGSVFVDGEPLAAARRGAGVGIVFQSPESQLFAESVLDDVAFGPGNLGRSREEAREAARRALEMVGLDPTTYGDRSPFGLSGGEARRVALAGVLSMNPAYLLADEPTAGLDSGGRAAVRSAFRRLRETAGIVVVTHDAEEFMGEADRVLALRDGRPTFSGAVDQLLADLGQFERAGLKPPPLLELQQRLSAAGTPLDRTFLDPGELARAIAGSRGGTV